MIKLTFSSKVACDVRGGSWEMKRRRYFCSTVPCEVSWSGASKSCLRGLSSELVLKALPIGVQKAVRRWFRGLQRDPLNRTSPPTCCDSVSTHYLARPLVARVGLQRGMMRTYLSEFPSQIYRKHREISFVHGSSQCVSNTCGTGVQSSSLTVCG